MNYSYRGGGHLHRTFGGGVRGLGQSIGGGEESGARPFGCDHSGGGGSGPHVSSERRGGAPMDMAGGGVGPGDDAQKPCVVAATSFGAWWASSLAAGSCVKMGRGRRENRKGKEEGKEKESSGF
jgi:hypothetical protein